MCDIERVEHVSLLESRQVSKKQVSFWVSFFVEK